jgi:hypothetical protein
MRLQPETRDRHRTMLRTAMGSAIAAALADPATIEVLVNPDGCLRLDRLGEGRVDTGQHLAAAEVADLLQPGTLASTGFKAAWPLLDQASSMLGLTTFFDNFITVIVLLVAWLSLDLDRDQNNQQRKLDFLNQAGGRGIYNPYVLQDAVSPYQVMAGGIISASLITGINSDLPGNVVAQVTENVYDTVSGKYLLIPQGSRLIGTYDSVVAFGQSRALLVWQRIILPDGSSVQIENLPASDTSGYSGLKDKVDFHTWQLLKGVVLSTLLGVGTELSLGNQDSDLVRAIEQSTQQSVNRAGQRITEKNLNIQPTITIRQGMPLRVIVHKDLILRPFKG